MPKPEAFSVVLIDQALRDSGWDLLDDRRVRFELDENSGRGTTNWHALTKGIRKFSPASGRVLH